MLTLGGGLCSPVALVDKYTVMFYETVNLRLYGLELCEKYQISLVTINIPLNFESDLDHSLDTKNKEIFSPFTYYYMHWFIYELSD